MVWGVLGVRWADFGLLCMPLLPLHCISISQVDVLSYFRLSWRHRFGHIHDSPPCCCPLVVCRCALLPSCLERWRVTSRSTMTIAARDGCEDAARAWCCWWRRLARAAELSFNFGRGLPKGPAELQIVHIYGRACCPVLVVCSVSPVQVL